jgi:hypothetical protein
MRHNKASAQSTIHGLDDACPLEMSLNPLESAASPALNDAQIDDLLAHPHWASLGQELDTLIVQMPATAQVCQRTTILTWIYQQHGVMSFLEIGERLTGYPNVTACKKQLRYTLRGLEKLLLVRIVNFAGLRPERIEADDVIGRASLVSLTWTGMIWMRRAWQARARLATEHGLGRVHEDLVAEEDEGKANEPYWIENITGVDPDGPARRADRIAEALPLIRSVFDLASPAAVFPRATKRE